MAESSVSHVQRLFVRHQPAIRAFALGLTGDFALAEDVVQETFLTVSAKADDFQPASNFVAWACTIARFKVLELERGKRRFSKELVDSLAASAPMDTGLQDRLETLLHCIDKLPPKAREVIRLRYFSEHGLGEIAQILGRSTAGVNATLVKTREVLRECVRLALHAGDVGEVRG
ncbi:MAG: sigma-70 family RNA polymerase sigma factor [Planctomycetia bacterium]